MGEALRRLVRCLVVAGSLAACSSPIAAAAPPQALTGPNAINADGALVIRAQLHPMCQGRGQYDMYGAWVDSSASYWFVVHVKPYGGPGTYTTKNQAPNFLPLMHLEKNESQGSQVVFNVGSEGSVTVDPGQKTGHFDGKLLTKDGGQFRIYGNWSCTTFN